MAMIARVVAPALPHTSFTGAIVGWGRHLDDKAVKRKNKYGVPGFLDKTVLSNCSWPVKDDRIPSQSTRAHDGGLLGA